MNPFIALAVTLVILGLFFYILWWGLGRIALGEPWNKVAVVLLVLGTVIAAYNVLFLHYRIPLGL